MRNLIIVSFLMFVAFNLWSQLYVEKQTRHRFAQLNIGLDYQSSVGGNSFFINNNSELQSFELGTLSRPRFVIGGTHFWGHADFYIAIPLASPDFSEEDYTVNFSSGVQTAFKVYPWRIQQNKLRPYAGISLNSNRFQQSTSFGQASDRGFTDWPLMLGLTYNKGDYLVELGASWHYDNREDYFIARSTQAEIERPALYLNLSFRYLMDTTIPLESSWESGQSRERTESLEMEKALDGFFVGVGVSSAFWLSSKDLGPEYDFLGRFSNTRFPDFSVGHYWHKPDVNLVLNYRSYSAENNSFDVSEMARRRSFGLELYKFLFDYHGFVPFFGPSASMERLSYRLDDNRSVIYDVTDTQAELGFTFGWDIRPDRLQNWILRTNLRYYPWMNLQLDDQSVSFSALEFNFIQLIIMFR